MPPYHPLSCRASRNCGRLAGKLFTPEPLLEGADYNHVLDLVNNRKLDMERHGLAIHPQQMMGR